MTSYSQILRAKETFAECNDEANHETEKCKFVLLLNAIAIGVQDEVMSTEQGKICTGIK